MTEPSSAPVRQRESRRLLKSGAFLIVRDAAGLAQIVVTIAAVRSAVAALPEGPSSRWSARWSRTPPLPPGSS